MKIYIDGYMDVGDASENRPPKAITVDLQTLVREEVAKAIHEAKNGRETKENKEGKETQKAKKRV